MTIALKLLKKCLSLACLLLVSTIFFTVEGYLWGLLPPPFWESQIFDSIESCLHCLGLFVLVLWHDFWIINQCPICNCVIYPQNRWSQGHIPFKVSLSGVLCRVSNLTVSYEIFAVGVDIYLCPHNLLLNTLAKSSSSVMVFIDCAPKSLD